MSQVYSTSSFHPAFSPWLAEPEQLSRTLVGNQEIMRDILARLAAVEAGSPANHQLLVGPRGIGKTHILCLTGHYVSHRLPPPQDWAAPGHDWICALFTEEEYAGQDTLANFLLGLFEKLRENAPADDGLDLPLDLAGKPDKAVAECCFETLHGYHNKSGKRILLLVDNLQKVLQQWTIEEHHQLRKFLSASRFVVIIGSAPSVFREVLDQKAALHDFFEIRVLSELTSGQMLELLGKRFQEDNRANEFDTRRDGLAKKIAAIEVLTGGNPRLVLFLYQIVARSTFLEIETSLRMLLEELREYFVRRFDELPEQARKILDTIAQMAGPATPTQIAAAARVRPQLVNAQLQRLKTAHLVRPVKLKRQRATRYDITERLFRIWRQTAMVAGHQRFKFLADFLRLYFTPDEVCSLYRQHIAALSSAETLEREEVLRHVDELYYFQPDGEGEIRYGAFANRIDNLRKLGEMKPAEEEAKYFDVESSRQGDRTGVVEACKQELARHVEAGRLKEALDDLDKLFKESAYEEAAHGAESILQRDRKCAPAREKLGIALGHLGEHARALDAFRKAVAADKPLGRLWLLQSLALRALGRDEEALMAAERATALEPRNSAAWQALGTAASGLANHKRALGAFQKAAGIGKPSAVLWVLQSFELSTLGRWEEALTAAEQAVSLDAADHMTWMGVGTAALHLRRNEQALEALRKATEISPFSVTLWRLQTIALKNLNRMKEALQAAEQVTTLAPTDPHGWLQKAWMQGYLGQLNDALSALERAVSCGATEKDVRHTRGDLLLLFGQYGEALRELEAGLRLNSEDWDMLAGSKIAKACLGKFGPLMEALPAQLIKASMAPGSELPISEYLTDVALSALRRNETTVSQGLWNALLCLERYHDFEWFGTLCGTFLRRSLDIAPGQFVAYVERLGEKVKNERVLTLLNPFRQAAEFIQSKDLSILERLFPEVGELVLDIVKRVSPGLVVDLRMHSSPLK